MALRCPASRASDAAEAHDGFPRLQRIRAARAGGEQDQPDDASNRAAGGRSGVACRREHGPATVRRGSRARAAARGAVDLEGARHGAQRRQEPVRVHDQAARGRYPAASTSAVGLPVRVRAAGQKAEVIGAAHRLRHTFCSHLAMRGAPARAIQELAGHQDLATTQRYMHLSPAALDAAIRLLETGSEFRGEIVQAAGKS